LCVTGQQRFFPERMTPLCAAIEETEEPLSVLAVLLRVLPRRAIPDRAAVTHT
jgi:hypothetical protein